VSAGLPVTKEPVDVARQDGKRLDGLTLIPWQHGKPLTWDVTVAHTLADSYVSPAAHSGGTAAEQAAVRKSAKYDQLVQSSRLFQPIAAETLGPFNESAISFLSSWAVRTRLFQVTAESPASFFSACLSSSSDSIPFCFTAVSLATRSDHSSFA